MHLKYPFCLVSFADKIGEVIGSRGIRNTLALLVVRMPRPPYSTSSVVEQELYLIPKQWYFLIFLQPTKLSTINALTSNPVKA